MKKSEVAPTAQPFMTVEKISSGFLIIDSRGKKTHKQTLNGVVNFIENYWGLRYIIKPEEEIIHEEQKNPDKV